MEAARLTYRESIVRRGPVQASACGCGYRPFGLWVGVWPGTPWGLPKRPACGRHGFRIRTRMKTTLWTLVPAGGCVRDGQVRFTGLWTAFWV